MHPASPADALEALSSMQKGQPTPCGRRIRSGGTVKAKPLSVPALPDLLALKVMSGRARDDADVVELLKRHHRRIPQLRRRAAQRLRTDEATRRLDALVERAVEELARRRR